MSDSTASSQHDYVEQLAEEFLKRVRCGQKLSIEDFCAQHGKHADELRNLLEMMELLEDLHPDSAAPVSMHEEQRQQLEELTDYRIVRELGRGGMGIVYEAQQLSLGRRVALKVLPIGTRVGGSARIRFAREARTAASLHHTNIVPVFEVGEECDCFYYAMQFIEGRSLDRVVKELDKLHFVDFSAGKSTKVSGSSGVGLTVPSATGSSVMSKRISSDSGDKSHRDHFYRSVARIGLQAADALAHAHARGVIHRDIKPSNLILDSEGVVWVTDFGLASTQNDEGLTQTGEFLGTLRYMSPERFSGICDARADIYALGLTLYELLAGRPVFDSSNRLKLIDQIKNSDPPSLQDSNRGVPRDLETIVLKAIEKNPESRYGSADELAADLDCFLHDEPIHARRASFTERFVRWSRRNPPLAASIILSFTLLMLVAVGGAAISYRESARRLQTTRDLYAAQMHSAGEAYGDRDGYHRQRAFLDAWRPSTGQVDFRGWEWYFLQSTIKQQSIRLDGFTGPDWDAVWSPDGRRIAASRATQIVIHDLDNRTTRPVGEGNSMTFALRWSPDGSRLVVARQNSTVEILDATTGEKIGTLEGCDEGAEWWHVVWTRDGSKIAGSSWDHSLGTGKVMIWNAETTKRIGELPEAGSIDWNPAGTELVMARNDSGALEVWDPFELRLLRHLGFHDPVITCVRWSPDGNHVASASDAGTIRIFDAHRDYQYASGARPLRELHGHVNNVMQVDWSPNGKWLASASRDLTVGIWRADTGEQIEVLKGHTEHVLNVMWSPDGERLLSGGMGESLRVWYPEQSDTPNSVEGHKYHVWGVAWNPDGNRLASVDGDGRLLIWDPNTAEVVQQIKSDRVLRSVEWSKDGTLVAAIAHQGPTSVWRTDNGELQQTIGERTTAFNWQDGSSLTVRSESSVVTWDCELGQKTGELPTTDSEYIFRTSPDGKYVATASASSVRVRSLRTNVEVASMRSEGAPHAIRWTPDSNRMLVVTETMIGVWNSGDQDFSFILDSNGYRFMSADWSPDGSRLASVDHSGRLKVWDASTGTNTLTLKASAPALFCISWSPDGRSIVTGGSDGHIRIWDASPAYQLAE